MDGYSAVLVLFAGMIWVGFLFCWGYEKRAYGLNYELGRAIGQKRVAFPVAAAHRRVIRNCLIFSLVGGLVYLIGWWLAGEKGVEAGIFSVQKIPDLKHVQDNGSG